MSATYFITIKLNGFYYLNFTDFSYDQSLDSVASSFSLACRFDNENRSLFKPLSFPKVEFFNDEEKLFFLKPFHSLFINARFPLDIKLLHICLLIK